MSKLKFKVTSCLLVIMLFWAAPAEAAGNQVFREVQNLITEYYVDPVDVSQLRAANARGLVRALNDPHSMYLTAEQYELFIGSIDRQYTGIGIYIDSIPVNEGILILDIIPDSPAQEAGLQSQDIITRIDNQNIAGMTLDEAYELLNGTAGSPIELDILRQDNSYHFQMIRAEISEPAVRAGMLDFNTGYIDIDSFSENAPQEMNEAVKQFQARGADKWIVDLQSNPGGYLDTAQSIGGLFIGTNAMITVQERAWQNYLYSSAQDTIMKGPAIVLIDGDSASASELLAAALKDYRRAVIMGERSYGKGSIQQLYPLSNGDWVKLTIARFFSPQGNPIDGTGIEPDIEVADVHAIPAAELLLADPQGNDAGSFSLTASGYEFSVDLDLIRDQKYWAAWWDIVDDNTQPPVYHTAANKESASLTRNQVEQKWPLYYPQAHSIGQVDTSTASPKIYFYVSKNLLLPDKSDIRAECRNSQSGENIPTELQVVNEHMLTISMKGNPEPGEYWMLLGTRELESQYLLQVFID